MGENNKAEVKINPSAFIRQVGTANTNTPESTVPIESKTVSEQTNNQADSFDYQSTFLCRNELIHRQGIHIEKETNKTIKSIVSNIGDERLTVSGFIENVLKHHFEIYKDKINGLFDAKISRPIK